jgi:hypothetical protein
MFLQENVLLDPLDGARLLSLSYYIVVNLINPKFFGAAMGLIQDKNLAMIFSKFSKRRFQQVNNKGVGQG